jgi:hypothetical protein
MHTDTDMDTDTVLRHRLGEPKIKEQKCRKGSEKVRVCVCMTNLYASTVRTHRGGGGG